MADQIKPRGMEQDLIAALGSSGWQITSTEREAGDLELSVVSEDVGGRIFVLYASETKETKPAFIRIDLGDRKGQPDNWSAWKRVVELSDYDSHYDGKVRYHLGYQGAYGAGWSSVGVGIYPAPPAGPWEHAIEGLVTRIEQIHPARDEATRSAAFDVDAAVGKRAERKERMSEGLAIVVLCLLFVGLLTVTTFGIWSGSGDMFAVGLICTIIVASSGTIALVAQRRRKSALSFRWDEPVGLLETTGVFDRLNRHAPQQVMDFAVLREGPEGSAARAADVLRQRTNASSSRHGLRCSLTLVRIDWLKSTREVCRVVPARWAVLQFSGAKADLDKLPSGLRETRCDNGVTWRMTQEEIDGGELTRRMELLADALGNRSPQPYR